MEIFIYAKKKSGHLRLLLKEIEKAIPGTGIKEFNKLDTLGRQIKNSPITLNNATVTILIISGRNEFKMLKKMCSHITETKIIILLSDKEPETIKSGYSLYPRYLDFIDSNFKEVGKVLTKINQSYSARAEQ